MLPSLLILAPCDNVLVNKEHESTSLIVLLTTVTFPKPPEDFKNAAAPMRWFIFTNWATTAEHWGKNYEQRIALERDGVTIIENTETMVVEQGKFHHRIVGALNAFPLVDAGMYSISVKVREQGEEAWSLAGEYPLLVAHT